MSLTQKLATGGEQAFQFNGTAGLLEAIMTVPEKTDTPYFAMLGHPHSLQGGTMNNKVVTTMARAFRELGIPSVRFNFRGVGLSAGTYDEGMGESDDMLAFVRLWRQESPHTHFLFAGFSFGSYVAYRAAAQCDHHLLITIAPPVHHYNYREFAPEPAPWIVIQGEEDEVVPATRVFDFVANSFPALLMIPFKDTGHFFHGKLLELKSALISSVSEALKL